MVVVDQVRNIGSLRFRAPSSPGCRARTCPGSPRKGTFWPARTRAVRTGTQHIARIVPGIRGASRPLGPGDPQAHGRRRRPVVDIRGLVAGRRGAHARLQARQSGGAGRIRRIVKQAAPGGRRLRGPRRSAARAKDIGERCRDRGIPHGKALKAVARKRLEVIYAIMGGQGSVRSLTVGGDRSPGRACVSIAKNAHRKGESLLTELQEHPHARELP